MIFSHKVSTFAQRGCMRSDTLYDVTRSPLPSTAWNKRIKKLITENSILVLRTEFHRTALQTRAQTLRIKAHSFSSL
jgi:hypothetical protein